MGGAGDDGGGGFGASGASGGGYDAARAVAERMARRTIDMLRFQDTSVCCASRVGRKQISVARAAQQAKRAALLGAQGMGV